MNKSSEVALRQKRDSDDDGDVSSSASQQGR